MRHYCFTIFDEKWGATFKFDEKGPIRYLMVGVETCPETKRQHYQCYAELHKPQRLTGFQKILGVKCHVEARRGSREQARDYCKKDGLFVEHGLWDAGGQGKRSDIVDAYTDLKNGASDLEMLENHTSTMIRYGKGLKDARVILAASQPVNRETKTLVLWGPSGTGKSHAAAARYPLAYRLVKGPTGWWWDGYTGQKEVLVEEFYGQMAWADLLKLIDIYPHNVPTKGGTAVLLADTFVFTSNKPPTLWYPEIAAKSGLEPLLRRINKVVWMGVKYVPPVVAGDPFPEFVSSPGAPGVVTRYEVSGNTDTHFVIGRSTPERSVRDALLAAIPVLPLPSEG